MEMYSVKNRIYLMDTEPLRDPNTAEEIYKSLPESRRLAADKYKFLEDRLRALASGALLLKLCEEENLSYEMTDLTVNPYGKPYFSEHPDICFNLSHSGAKVILGVSDHDIGCDIEVIHDNPVIQTIAQHCFSPEENQMLLEEANAEARLRLFYRLWTLRESYIKETGLGFYMPFRSFRIHLSENTAAVRLIEPLDTKHKEFVSENVSFFEYDTGGQYCCSCCMLQKDTPCEKPELIPVYVIDAVPIYSGQD